MTVLFVCSGNICRSPMAEVSLRRQGERAGLERLTVCSAGTLGLEGVPASNEAIEAVRELGLNLGDHRSTGVSAAHLERADLVVVMAQHHLLELAAMFPKHTVERRLLRSFEPGPSAAAHAPDLPDPIGHPLPFYREQLKLIERCNENLAAHLLSRS